MTLSRREALAGASALSFSAVLAACAPADGTANPTLKAVIDGMTTDILKDAPELATSLAAPEALAGGPYEQRLSETSLAAEANRNAMVSRWIAALEKIEPKSLNAADKTTHAIALSSARYSQAGARFGYGSAGYGSPNPYVVSQLTGSYVGVPDFLDSQHNVKSKADAEAWIARVEAFAGQLGEEAKWVQRDAEKGVIAPDFILDRALGQMRNFAKQPANQTVLVAGLVRKAKESGLDAAGLGAACEKIVTDKVMPAYRNQMATLEGLRTKATSDAGVWKLPNGADYYAASLAYWTTTKMSPDEVHMLGLDLVRSYNSEMDEGLKKLGMTQGSVAERMTALGKEAKYLYPNDNQGKEKLIADLNAQIQELRKRLPKMFSTLPKAQVEVKRVPAYTEAGAPGGYYQVPAPDGSRPGAYYINLRDTTALPKWTLPTLTYHESEPGHHLQIALAQEADGLPYLRSKILWFGAYGEGWALYAEQLAEELGMYEQDIAGRLGYSQSMAFRAARCVVDTGIHFKKWTKEQAVTYMMDATGDSRDNVVTEIERYCVWPGQATCYMVGKTDLIRLRANARTALAEKFDIRAFHDKVLLQGPMPLDVLETVVQDWQKGVK